MLFIIGISIAFFLDLLLISKKRKTLADKILAFWLFFIGVHILLFYLIFTGKSFEHDWLPGIEIPLPLLHGPFLYLYTAALTNQLPPKKKLRFLHFIPAVASYLYLIKFYVLPAEQKFFVYQNKGIGFEAFTIINLSAIIISGITYIIWSGVLLRRHRFAILNQFSYTEKINLKWLQYLVYGIAAIWLLVIFGSDELIYGAVVLFVLFIGYFGIKQVGIFTYTYQIKQMANVEINNEKEIHQQILEEPTEAEEESTPHESFSEQNEPLPETLTDETIAEVNVDKRKYSKSGLTGEIAEILHKKLTKLMESEKLYSGSELSLSELAKRLNTHPNNLSQVINEKEGKNFYDYINTLRIEEFKRLISNPDNQKFTILSLAYECGFNSKSSFNRYFKKVTGQSPSGYLHNVNMEGIQN